MKPYLSRIVLSLTIFMCLAPFSLAEDPINEEDKQIPFPYPAGPVKVSNGYQGTSTHQGYSKYALDMQVPFKDPEHPKESHNSCDQYGIPVIAVREGEVVRARNKGEDGSFGTHVIIKSGKNIHIWYAHLIEDSLQVAEGDKVQQGQLLGLMGDTGNTAGVTCKRETVNGKGEAITKTLNGVHLHTEIRDGMYGYTDKASQKFIPPIPLKYTALLGAKTYTDIVVGDYVSTSLLTKDENGYWNKMKDHFLYKLPSDAVGDVSPNFYKNSDPQSSSPSQKIQSKTDNPSPSGAKIISLSPNHVNEDEFTTFTITGEKLPQNLELTFPVCNGSLEWLKRGPEKQQFTCTIDLPGTTVGSISLPDQKTSGGKKINMNFEIYILKKDETFVKPTYNGFPDVPKSATPGDKVNLSVTGHNLPAILIFEAPFCADFRYIYRGMDRQTIECEIADHAYDKNGKLKNEIISHPIEVKNEAGEKVVKGDLVLDHKIQIESITPPVAYFGQKTSFTLKGKGVDKLKTFHLDYCQDLVVLSQSSLKNQVVIQCILPVPEKFFSTLMPDVLKRKTLNLHIKDKPEGEMILAGKIEAIAFPESWVAETSPYSPPLGKNTTFIISGKHLPDKLLYWMANCGQGVVTSSGSEKASFTCKPEPIGTNAVKNIELAALKVKENPEAFVKEIEKQRRLLEIKYPKEYLQEGKSALTIYRGYVLPLPENYADLYFNVLKNLAGDAPSAFWLDVENREEIIGYIVSHPGDYSNSFLKKVGWKNMGSAQKPFYELMACSKTLEKVYKNYGRPTQSQLNVTGLCAKGLDITLIEKDFEKLYTEKTK